MAPFRVAASPELPEIRKVALLQSRPNSLPALRSGEHPEVQHIWIYCVEQEEAQELASFCHSCRRPKLVPEIVQNPGLGADFDASLRRCVPKIPCPYTCDEWEEFSRDVRALLFASISSCRLWGQRTSAAMSANDRECFQHLQCMRWPALFVTDRKKLAHALTDWRVHTAIGATITLQTNDVLPVILATDFGLLTGNLVIGPPLDACDSLALKEMVLALKASDFAQHRPASQVDTQCCKHVIVRPGIYMQRPDANSGVDCGREILFGARALALFHDGQCAYSAISPDGIRSIELSGTWNVINGHIVLDTVGRHPPAHFLLHDSRETQLSNVTYSEAVHVSLECFEADFVPLSLADCLPEGSEHLYTGLVETEARPDEEDEIESEVEPMELEAETSMSITEETVPFASANSELSGRMTSSANQSKILSRSAASGRLRPPVLTDVTTPKHSAKCSGSPNSLKTPQHALSRIASDISRGWGHGKGSKSLEKLSFPPSPAPHLLGKDRRISKVSMALIHARKSGSSPIFATDGHVTLTGGLEFVRALQDLNSYVAFTAPSNCDTLNKKDGAQSFATSPLQPGKYLYRVGMPDLDDFRSLEIVLHADGSCKYNEIANGSTLRSLCGATIWRVDRAMLVVDSKKAGAHAFSFREARGTKMVERRVKRIKIPWKVLQQYCTYEQFAQQHVPFPGHVPLDESECVFGLIDPNSPVLRSMKCRPHRLPYSAFEQELRRHHFPCDRIISDFHFLDRNDDGQISVSDLRGLETYGNPVAAPEVIEELREALLARFGSLDIAFEALIADASGGRASLSDFEVFLMQSSEDVHGHKGGGSSQKMKEWLSNTDVEDRKAVFASLNPNCHPGIDMTDFMSLNLHAAVVALRRLEHFQAWICEQFGQSPEAYVHIFRAIDKDRSQVLSRRVFADGLQRLGYPCSIWANSMFALLDLNFSGELSVNNFKRLCDFNAAKMLMSLQDLKMVVDSQFKGVDECYRWLLLREMAFQGASRMPRAVSFKTFQTMCRKGKFAPGYGSKRPDIDLRMLFLFLDITSGKPRSDGFLTKNDWSLLNGLNSRSLAGSPARLRRILEQRYGGMDQAFEAMHTAWLERALPRGLRHTALTRLARVLLIPASSPSPYGSGTPKLGRSSFLPPVSAPSAASKQVSSRKLGRDITSFSLPTLGLQHSQSAGGKIGLPNGKAC